MEGPGKRPWWSVRVSGVARLLLIVFAVLWTLALIVFAGDFVWRHWTTQNEKRAALHALDNIDEAKDSINADESTYQARYRAASSAVGVAQKVELTPRDRLIANELSIFLMELKVRRDLATHMPGFTDEEKKKFEPVRKMFEQRDLKTLDEQALRQALGATASRK